MFTIRQAQADDCLLINQLAANVFPATYKDILSQEQLEYMFDWMYAPQNIRKQMEEGHVYFIAYEECEPVDTCPYSKRRKICFICKKYMFFLLFRKHMQVTIFSTKRLNT